MICICVKRHASYLNSYQASIFVFIYIFLIITIQNDSVVTLLKECTTFTRDLLYILINIVTNLFIIMGTHINIVVYPVYVFGDLVSIDAYIGAYLVNYRWQYS